MTWTKINPEDTATFPESGKKVLVAIQPHYGGQRFLRHAHWKPDLPGWEASMSYWSPESVTHWQPLPALPGEETGQATDRYALAARVVEAVCNDRRGLHWDFDDDIKAKLRAELARLIRCAMEGAEPDDDHEKVMMRIARGEFGT